MVRERTSLPFQGELERWLVPTLLPVEYSQLQRQEGRVYKLCRVLVEFASSGMSLVGQDDGSSHGT